MRSDHGPPDDPNPHVYDRDSTSSSFSDDAGRQDERIDGVSADGRPPDIQSDPPSGVDGPGDAVLLPDDAGPHAAALEAVLRRIPPRWGRWIDTGPGWYLLIVDTDTRLAVLDPDYIVHQVKEKYGTLRYYCAPSGDDPNPALLDAFVAITDDAEHASGITCEQCGEPATPQRTPCRVKTLCASCAPRRHGADP